MSASESSTDEPGPPSDNGEHGAQPRHNVVVRALTGLKGWQAIPAAVIALYFFLGIFGPSLAPFDPEKSDLKNRFCPPLAIEAFATSISPASDCSATNVLGTDQIGRDIFSGLLHGARTSLWVVGLSVLIGTAVGSVVGAVVNGWRMKPRMVLYAIALVTVVPFAIFVFALPHILYIYFDSALASGSVDWSTVVALSSFSAVLTFALVAVAHRYDEACRGSWFREVSRANSTDRGNSFCGLLHRQIIVLAPWIGLATMANAALVFIGSGSRAYLPSAITWSYEWEHLLEHIGMFSALLPMVLFPTAFVTFGVWWFVRHVKGRLKTTSKVSSGSEELAVEVSESTDEDSERVESGQLGNDGDDALIDSGSSAKGWRLILVVFAIVAAIAAIRFGVAEAVPIIRELAQDSYGSYQSAQALSLQGQAEALDCADQMSAKVRTLRTLPPEDLEIEASQRCLDRYFQYRNAPTHRLTIGYALRFVTQTLTLGLIAAIVSAAMWVATSTSAIAVRRTVTACVFLVTLLGLTLTFGSGVWPLVVLQWIDPVVSVTHDKSMATSRALNIVRDFSVALGVSYLTIAIVKPTFRLGRTVPKIDALSDLGSFIVPCVMLTAGLLIVFHYRFPAIFLFLDEQLGVIVNPTEEFYFSSNSLAGYWLWTYWFALIGYAAIVVGFFYAAMSGFSRYARDRHDSEEAEALVSPDSPSQDADPT